METHYYTPVNPHPTWSCKYVYTVITPDGVHIIATGDTVEALRERMDSMGDHWIAVSKSLVTLAGRKTKFSKQAEDLYWELCFPSLNLNPND